MGDCYAHIAKAIRDDDLDEVLAAVVAGKIVTLQQRNTIDCGIESLQ
jgi:hypothetical protein